MAAVTAVFAYFVEVLVKIQLEIDIPGLEARISDVFRERELTLDQLVSGIPISRETARKILIGSDTSKLHAVLSVCSEIGFDLQEVKTLVMKKLEEQNFQLIAEEGKLLKKKHYRKVVKKK